MKLHGNAALSLNGRRRMVRSVIEHEATISEAAQAAGVSDRTCSKWVARYRAEGEAGLLDRSSAPHHVHNRIDETTVTALAALRRLRFTAPELADLIDMPVSTISGILKRIGMGKLGRLGMEPAVRYERECPGELIHIDVKKLGRIKGGPGKRITGGGGHNARRRLTDAASPAGPPAGMPYMSRSMTPRAWPTSRFCPTRRPSPPLDSSDARSRTSPATASRSRAS